MGEDMSEEEAALRDRIEQARANDNPVLAQQLEERLAEFDN